MRHMDRNKRSAGHFDVLLLCLVNFIVLSFIVHLIPFTSAILKENRFYTIAAMTVLTLILVGLELKLAGHAGRNRE